MSHVLIHAMWELPTYHRHCEVIKKSLKDELESLEQKMEVEFSGMNENEMDSYFSNINDHWIETAETLPRLQWYSQLLIVYGHFEKLLNDLCNEQKNERKIQLSLKDLHGQGIERARNYLSKVVGVNECFQKSEWQKIKSISVLRNAVAHRDGFVDYEPNSSKSAYSRLSNINGVELRRELRDQEDAQAFFTDSVVLEFLENFDTFIRNLNEELKMANKRL